MKYLIVKKNYLLLAMLVVFGISACKKIEDLVMIRDPLAIDAGIWDDEASIQYLLNDSYQFIMPNFIYEYTGNNYGMHLVSDENYYSANDNWGKKYFNFNGFLQPDECRYVANKYAGANYGENRYFDIAKVNLGIKNLPGSIIPDADKKSLLGQFYALRGMAYMGLTKIYGGMPLVLEPQSPGVLTLKGREKASVMFESIVRDYDSAMANLKDVVWTGPEGSWGDQDIHRGKFNPTAVAALKAKALLWWASPLFNPGEGAHPERWQAAHKAAQEAYNIALAAGYGLMSNYSAIFQVEGAANKEAILVRSYSSTQYRKFHAVESRSRPGSEGGSPNDVYNPSQQMINAYLMKDGRPRTNASSEYPYNDTIFWANRDPRFDATIAFNGSVWPLSAKTNRRQWTYAGARVDGQNESAKPFYVKRFTMPNLARTSVAAANDVGGSGMDWIEIRLAEVMMDYAETANETGDITTAKDMVRQIRKRAGVVQGDMDYGLTLATNKEQMRELIMNERMVEFAFEGKRNDDLRRTRRMHQLEGTLGQMVQMQFQLGLNKDSIEAPIGENDLGISPTSLRRDTLDFYNPASVIKWFRYPYVYNPPSGNGAFAMPEEYYFFPLSNQFLNSTPLLEQTIGWSGGIFDPL
ncbi:RagB/SusD family nutrient uptake outer membrane protein [Niabella yanshanensis]|uniref:RagB/SusD family nutrient uptake outer membrane protein n=1 Tax=Niabella yanshanensis TaxID=577386 RepID=A0ABZ0W9U8_9BACT|nr:RagB/SusD family nutrient uptake outer membrane protein [Niabella yanshanensis]WQD39267.1 RagB/SusD family nutrient uptake outer membrane protein [Niabella yanshanensis]